MAKPSPDTETARKGGHFGAVSDDDRRLRVYVDQARRGSRWAMREAVKALRDTGRFRGMQRSGARRVVASWLQGCDPDLVAEVWADFVAGGGLR